MGKRLKGSITGLLARVPKLYLAVLKTLERGSPEKRMYLSIVKRGDVVLDVGANVGYFTQLFSDLVGSRGQVHAFEPVPATFELLSKNVTHSPNRKNVFSNCMALGDRDEETTIFIPNGDVGQAALARHQTGSWTSDRIQAIRVQLMRLDGYADRLSRVNFVKCDVEGAELMVLRGGMATLRRFKPMIFLEVEECWTRSFGWTPDDVVRLLREIGYRHFYGLGEDGLKSQPESGTAINGGLLCSWEKMSGMA